MAINRGSYDKLSTLKALYPVVDKGDYAQILEEGISYVYNNGWNPGSPISEIITFPSRIIYVDCNRIDTYVEDGTIGKPFKTISAAMATVNSAFAIHLAPGDYFETGNLSLPDYPMTVYGNHSTLTVTGGVVTVNNIHSIYDLNTVGTIVYAYTGTERSLRIGGSINGTMTIQGGFPHFDSLNYTGTMTITGGTPYFRGMTGGGSIVVNDVAALVIFNDCNLNKENVSSANLTVTAGQVMAKGSIFINKGDTANIVFNNSNLPTTAHDLTQVYCNYGVACGSAYTIIAPDNLIPVITGTAILAPVAIPYFGVGGGVAQTQTVAIPILASAYYPGMRIQYVASVANTGTAPTLNVNSLGAKTVIKRSGSALASGDIALGAIVDLIYDGTYFRVMSA